MIIKVKLDLSYLVMLFQLSTLTFAHILSVCHGVCYATRRVMLGTNSMCKVNCCFLWLLRIFLVKHWQSDADVISIYENWACVPYF